MWRLCELYRHEMFLTAASDDFDVLEGKIIFRFLQIKGQNAWISPEFSWCYQA